MQQPEDIQEPVPQETTPENAENAHQKPAETESTTNPSAAAAGSPPPDSSGSKDELAEAKDKYLRLYAEFENFRRRTSRERLELIQSANEQVLKALLPISDDFDRAEKSIKDLSSPEAEGFMLILNKFRKVLEQQGLKPMDTADGKFNPDLHEAITQVPMPDKAGQIIDVVEKGYLLNDKVIRHAKVVVGS